MTKWAVMTKWEERTDVHLFFADSLLSITVVAAAMSVWQLNWACSWTRACRELRAKKWKQ